MPTITIGSPEYYRLLGSRRRPTLGDEASPGVDPLGILPGLPQPTGEGAFGNFGAFDVSQSPYFSMQQGEGGGFVPDDAALGRLAESRGVTPQQFMQEVWGNQAKMLDDKTIWFPEPPKSGGLSGFMESDASIAAMFALLMMGIPIDPSALAAGAETGAFDAGMFAPADVGLGSDAAWGANPAAGEFSVGAYNPADPLGFGADVAPNVSLGTPPLGDFTLSQLPGGSLSMYGPETGMVDLGVGTAGSIPGVDLGASASVGTLPTKLPQTPPTPPGDKKSESITDKLTKAATSAALSTGANALLAPSTGTTDTSQILRDLQASGDATLANNAKLVEDAFAGYGDDYYTGIADAYRKYATPLLDEQATEARRVMPFGFSSSAGSAYQRKAGQLERDVERGYADVGSEALRQADARRAAVEGSKANLLELVNSGADAETVANESAAQAKQFNAPPPFSPLANLFSVYASDAANAAIARAALGQGGGGFSGGGVSLFKRPASSAQRIIA